MDTAPIIVINHDKTFLDMMCDFLAGEGYAATCWHADDDTFVDIQAAQPALAIVDIDIHRRDAAWMLIETIHNDPTTAHIPVIVCTADVTYVRGKAAELLKYKYAVVEKPFHLADMLTQIRDMLASPDSQHPVLPAA